MRPSRLLPCFALLALLSAGCQSEPEPRFADPTPSPTESVSSSTLAPSPTTSESTEPTAEPEEESAQEFIRRFQDAAFVMQNTGDPRPYLELTSGCASCEALAAAVDATYDSGGSAEAGGGDVRQLEPLGRRAGFRVFEYVLVSRPTVVLAADGSVVERFPGGTERFQVTVGMSGGAWRVFRLVNP